MSKFEWYNLLVQRKLLFLSFVLILGLGILHSIASQYYFYWIYWWFDNVVHFLGGLSIGLFVLWVMSFLNFFSKRQRSFARVIIIVLILIFVIGVGWEIFEYMNGLTQSTENYSLDIAHDLLADVFGAFCAGLIFLEIDKSHE